MRHAIRLPLAIVLAAALVLMAVPAGALSIGSVPINQCLDGKLKCARTMKRCLLKALTLRGGTDSDPGGLHRQACRDHFDGGSTPAKGCFAKLEADLSCLSVADTATIARKIETFVADTDRALDPPPTHDASRCRVGKLKCVKTYDTCMLELVRRASRATGVIDPERLAKCTAILSGPTSCFAKLESKLTCETEKDQDLIHHRDDVFLEGLIGDLILGPREIANQRCTGDTFVRCTTPADCAGIGTCEYFVGSAVPANVGGIGACVLNRIGGSLGGTVNVSTGAAAGSVALTRDIYNGISLERPCPTCDGDSFLNDGAADGTCAGGTRNGLPCDANGSSAIPPFGTTSLDCPPTPGGFITTLKFDLTAANEGTASLPITAASPPCRGKPSVRCPCDVCSLATGKTCTSNADCVGFGTCGGGPAGEPPLPNPCFDGVCNVALGNGQFVCADGPIDHYCKIDSFRGCLLDSDCPQAGDSCEAVPRPCFPGSGAVGDTITAAGAHDTPDLHNWPATFGSTYCSPVTSWSVTNAILGLPGPGRLRVSGTLSDDGTSGTCPTHLTFVPNPTVGGNDLGWWGLGHDEHVVSNAAVTAAVSACAGSPPSCGECSFSGPVPNPHAP